MPVDSCVRASFNTLVMNEILIALGGILVGAVGSHLLSQQRERAAEKRRASYICRLLFRDLFHTYLTIHQATYKNQDEGWPPSEGGPFRFRVENWQKLGPDFTMVCRDEDLWEAVCMAYEEAEFLETEEEIDRHRLKRCMDRIEDAVSQTAAVNRSWSSKIRNRWYARRAASGEDEADSTLPYTGS